MLGPLGLTREGAVSAQPLAYVVTLEPALRTVNVSRTKKGEAGTEGAGGLVKAESRDVRAEAPQTAACI